LCGIAGIIGERAKEEAVRKMCAVIRYRGPDDEGCFTRKGIALGSVRLSIIDLETGHQPIHNEDSSLWIVCNGEIFNYRELRNELQERHRFYTRSDTEVIVHLYEDLGQRCLEKLNGMFAFAVWDEKKRELFLARDRVGVKPLYYCSSGSSFLFASEIKAILQFGIERKLDPEALIDYLSLTYVLGDKTFFKGVRQVPAGHFLTVRGGAIELQRYWDLEFGKLQQTTVEKAAHKVLDAIQESVRLRLVSDVPLGCHLSGGIDSSVVACMASRLLGGRVKTFTGAFDEGAEFDETAYARLASEFVDTEYHEIRPSGTDLLPALERLVWHMDYPEVGPGIYPQYWVCRLAREHVKVILGGQGGDEAFFGYPFILQLALEEDLTKLRSLGPRYPLKLYYYLKLTRREKHMLSSLRRLARLILKERDLEPGIRLYRHVLLHSRESLEKLLVGEFRTLVSRYSPEQDFVKIFMAPSSSSFLDRAQYLFVKAYLHALLHVEDRTSMAVSLESRVPLCCDHRLLELVASIPDSVKIDSFEPKYLLKEAVEGKIPDDVIQRRDKKGFPTPIGVWLRDQAKEVEAILLGEKAVSRGIFDASYVRQLLSEHASGKFDHGMTLFMLLNLEFWFRRFIDA